MAVSGSVVPHPVLGFEFVLVSPRLLIRAPPDSAFKALENPMCFSGLLPYLDWAFGLFLWSEKMHPKQRARRMIK
jgi:hypothetical protein